jgi:hypothetical protein
MLIPACSPQRDSTERTSPLLADSPRSQTESPIPPLAVDHPNARSDTLPPRIYYDLTKFEWYARGEALRFEDRDYVQSGPPVALATSALRKTGDFQGVDIYVLVDADSARIQLYIPVFEGFWLGFARDTSRTSRD